MTSLLSQVAQPWGERINRPGTWSVGEIAIAIVVIAAIVACVYVALSKFGVAIPDWVKTLFWIIVVAFAVIFCIRLLMSM